jgi:hypothetical protein
VRTPERVIPNDKERSIMDNNNRVYIYRLSSGNGYSYFTKAIDAYTEAFKLQERFDDVVYIDQFELVSSQYVDQKGDLSVQGIKL